MADDSVPIRDYVDRRFADQDRAVAAALAANEKRLDGLNESRQQRADEIQEYLRRNEYLAAQQAVNDRLDLMAKRQEEDRAVVLRIQGRFIGAAAALTVFVSAVTFLITRLTLAG